MIIFYTLTLMTAKPHKPSLIYSPIYHLPNSTYFRMCVIRNMREKEFYQIHLGNTGLNKLKLISILQSLSYANVHTNLQDVIISVYQSYLTMKPFDLEEYLRASIPWNILRPSHSSQSLCYHDAQDPGQISLSLSLPLSYLLPHLGDIAYALTIMSLPFPKTSTYIKKNPHTYKTSTWNMLYLNFYIGNLS